MDLPLDFVRKLQKEDPQNVWSEIFSYALEVCIAELSEEKAVEEVPRLDGALIPVDLFLATAGWDLWHHYYKAVKRTSEELKTWWQEQSSGRAVLILDALSLREMSWIIQGATSRGYRVHRKEATGAELPTDTTSFAKSLGFSQRSSLEQDMTSPYFPEAKTDSVNLPWKDCLDLVGASKDWILWHHWPDDRIHHLSTPGEGLSKLTQEVVEQLTSEDFWHLIKRLTTGRRLVITADHGYAASGRFPDVKDEKQTLFLKSRFKSGRSTKIENTDLKSSSWVPPLETTLSTPQGEYSFVLGRRKWKSPGGYPTLTHGGLSVLEVAVPFVELSAPAK